MNVGDLQKLLVSEFSFPSKERKSSSATYLGQNNTQGLKCNSIL